MPTTTSQQDERSPSYASKDRLQAQFFQSISQMCSIAPRDREASKQCSRLLAELMLDCAPPATLSSAVNITHLPDWEIMTKSIAIDLADVVLCRSEGSSGYDWRYNIGTLADITRHHFEYFVSRLERLRPNLWLKLAEGILNSYIDKPDGMVQFIREFPSVIETVMYAYVDAYNILTHFERATPRLNHPMLNKMTTFLLIGCMVKDGPPSENLMNISNLYLDFAANNFARFDGPLPLGRAYFSEALVTLQDEYSRFAEYLRAVAMEGSGREIVGKRTISQKLGLSRKTSAHQTISRTPGTEVTNPRKRPPPTIQSSSAMVQSERPMSPVSVGELSQVMITTQPSVSPTSPTNVEGSSGTVRRRPFSRQPAPARFTTTQAPSKWRASQTMTLIPGLSVTRESSRAPRPAAPKSGAKRWKI